MPPRTCQNILHDNGALQTTFEANSQPANVKSKHGGKGTSGKVGKNTVPSDPDGINPDSNTTSKRQQGRKGQQARAVADAAATPTAIPTAVSTATATATVAPTTVTPTTVASGPVAPTTVASGTVAPTTFAPGTVAPSTVTPTTVAHTTVAPTTVAPTTVARTTVAPTTVARTTIAPTTTTTTVAPTTIAPTTTTTTTVARTTATNLIDDDEENPFVDLPSQGFGDDQDSATWTSSESELGAPLRSRKEARDVRDFFSKEKGSWSCKYCSISR
ncbi:hypothetical protein F5888DRAFT_1640094 [Russula emetica]|nr:hypothetical protein F5888DRAFT_1640094 [Russula emetica]